MRALTDLTSVPRTSSPRTPATGSFCAHSRFEADLRRIHRVYRRRMQTLLRALAAHMPKGVEWTTPTGGYTLWLRLPGSACEEASICERLERSGIRVAPGRQYFAAGSVASCAP